MLYVASMHLCGLQACMAAGHSRDMLAEMHSTGAQLMKNVILHILITISFSLEEHTTHAWQPSSWAGTCRLEGTEGSSGCPTGMAAYLRIEMYAGLAKRWPESVAGRNDIGKQPLRRAGEVHLVNLLMNML